MAEALKGKRGVLMIRDLSSHPAPYVTIAELARHWRVSRRQIRKYIEAGTLEATILGPRLLRIRTGAAVELERILRIPTSTRGPYPSH